MQAYPDPPPAQVPPALPKVAGSESRSVGAEVEQEVINGQGGAQVRQEGTRGQGGAQVKTSTAGSERANSYDEELKPVPAPKPTTEEEGVSLLESMAIESQTLPEATVEGGLIAFFNSLISKSVVTLSNWSAKTLAPALLGAALFPFFGPVGSIAAAVGVAAVVDSIQDQLRPLGPLGLHLQDDTVNKLVEPLQGKKFTENELRKVVGEVLSDRQANEDLKQFLIKLLPIVREAASSTTINISGPVQGLIVGDNNTITQTFSGFLQDGL